MHGWALGLPATLLVRILLQLKPGLVLLAVTASRCMDRQCGRYSSWRLDSNVAILCTHTGTECYKPKGLFFPFGPDIRHPRQIF